MVVANKFRLGKILDFYYRFPPSMSRSRIINTKISPSSNFGSQKQTTSIKFCVLNHNSVIFKKLVHYFTEMSLPYVRDFKWWHYKAISDWRKRRTRQLPALHSTTGSLSVSSSFQIVNAAGKQKCRGRGTGKKITAATQGGTKCLLRIIFSTNVESVINCRPES